MAVAASVATAGGALAQIDRDEFYEKMLGIRTLTASGSADAVGRTGIDRGDRLEREAVANILRLSWAGYSVEQITTEVIAGNSFLYFSDATRPVCAALVQLDPPAVIQPAVESSAPCPMVSEAEDLIRDKAGPFETGDDGADETDPAEATLEPADEDHEQDSPLDSIVDGSYTSSYWEPPPNSGDPGGERIVVEATFTKQGDEYTFSASRELILNLGFGLEFDEWTEIETVSTIVDLDLATVTFDVVLTGQRISRVSDTVGPVKSHNHRYVFQLQGSQMVYVWPEDSPFAADPPLYLFDVEVN